MAKKIRTPIRSGVASVPIIMQLEALECGAACLTMILAFYRKWLPLEQVRADCGVSRDGSNARHIVQAARLYGLDAKGSRYEPEALKRHGSFPCIIHWEFNHFVVLNGFRGGKAYLNDPAKGAYSIPMKQFDDGFTGICLEFAPNESFVPSGKRESMFSFAAKRLKGTGGAIVFTALTAFLALLVQAIDPAFSRVFLDRLLSGKNPEWLLPFLLLLGAFDLIRIIASALEAVYSLRLSGKMAAIGNASYLWRLLKMPISFFSQRMPEDLVTRQEDNAEIANTLIHTFAPLLLNCVMMILYFTVMIRYSLLLTAVGLFSLTVNAFVADYISKKRLNITRVAMRDEAALHAAAVSGIRMVETIKASGAENAYFAHWSGRQARVNHQEIKYLKLDQYLGIIPEFIAWLSNSAVLILGVWMTMHGEFTVGMINAFQILLTYFMTPAMTFVSAGQTLLEMRAEMERIDDVMEYPCNQVFASESDAQEGRRKLSGKLEMKQVFFGYSPLEEPLIKNFSMTLEPGKSVAIVGASGCGKSTVANLISGLYRPKSGEILFDGMPLDRIEKSVFCSSVAVVDQEIILFEDTIANNIKMWDNSIEDFEMILAARDAQLHEDIMARPDGYRHRMTDGGKDFSGGQRQRLEIARVLAEDPTLIIMDEATSALDAVTEYEVVRAIRNRGIACIVIAHRLSTIRSCDQILLMDHGEIVARGTHESLMETNARYRELVISE